MRVTLVLPDLKKACFLERGSKFFLIFGSKRVRPTCIGRAPSGKLGLYPVSKSATLRPRAYMNLSFNKEAPVICQVKTFVKMIGVVLTGLMVVGCSGSGEMLNLDLRALPSAPGSLSQVKDTKTTKVFVQVLEDTRAETKRLGIRTHFGGGKTYYNVQGGDAGATIARIIAEYLRQEGRHSRCRHTRSHKS